MALKGMEAYMDSDEEGQGEEGFVGSNYSPVSGEDPDGPRSQQSLDRSTLDDDLKPGTDGFSAKDDGVPRVVYGFPQRLELTEDERVRIPDETAVAASPGLERKVEELLYKKRSYNTDITEKIESHKSFRNPSIYQKLIEHIGINEFGTNFSPEDFNPEQWSEASYVEGLATAQAQLMEKYDKDKKSKGGPEVNVKRKTKWDTNPKPVVNPRIIGQAIAKIPSSGNLAKITK